VNDQPANRDLPPTLDQPLPSNVAPETRAPTGAEIDAPPTIPPTLEVPGTLAPSPSTLGSAPRTQEDAAGPLPPGYEMIRRLGRGGMGVVYLARQTQLDRLVALKMVRDESHADADYRQRFQREAEAVAKLHHAGVVQIYDVGVHQGRPFFSMEFCKGGSLADHLRGTPLMPETAAAVIERVARAVHHAHANGIVHRDLKPDNIFLHDARLSARGSGQDMSSDDSQRALLTPAALPKVADFGLARKLNEDGQTKSGVILGTPSYMPPEQARGAGKQVGPAADIYALGAVLYECLVGRPPFLAATTMHTLLQVLNDDPVPPTRLNPKVPRDLEVICLTCLRKEPAQRYTTAVDMAEELRRYRAHEPIQARPMGRLERGLRWCRRNTTVAALLAVVAFTLATGTLVSLYFAFDASDQAREAKRREAEANEKEKAANDALAREKDALEREREMLAKQKKLLSDAARTYRRLSIGLCKQDHADEGLNWMLRAYETAPEDDPLRSDYLQQLHREGLQLGCVLRCGDKAHCVAFSPHGDLALIGGTTNGTQLWNVASGKLLATYGEAKLVKAVLFSPDGQLALTASDKVARLWDVSSGEQTGSLYHSEGLRAAAFSPDGHLILVHGHQSLVIWEVSSSRQIATLHDESFILGAAFSPDGRIAVGSNGLGFYLWDFAGQPQHHLFQNSGRIWSVEFSPDGHMAVSANRADPLRLWDVSTGEQIGSLPHEGDQITARFSPDGRLVLIAREVSDRLVVHSGEIELWDVATCKRLRVLRMLFPARAIAFSPDSRFLLTGSRHTAQLWDIALGNEISVSYHPRDTVVVGFSQEGRIALTASEDGTARLFDVAALQLHLKFKSPMVLSANGPLRLVRVRDTVDEWELPASFIDPPLASLRAWVLAQSGKQLDEHGIVRNVTTKEGDAAWKQLQDFGGEWFRPLGVEAWHRSQAQEAEDAEQPFAAAFHLRQLLAHNPADADKLLERLKSCEDKPKQP
jgi:WD40 repeat protein